MAKLMTYENKHRKAVIEDNDDCPLVNEEYPYTVTFYYDGYRDYEWKRGSYGIPCSICKTMKEAQGKARRYVAKG